jgi:hypothetical protein
MWRGCKHVVDYKNVMEVETLPWAAQDKKLIVGLDIGTSRWWR